MLCKDSLAKGAICRLNAIGKDCYGELDSRGLSPHVRKNPSYNIGSKKKGSPERDPSLYANRHRDNTARQRYSFLTGDA